ncbi:MAG TPA: hypothetical protein VF266_11145, partial [Thermoanaerobaculia bacterium]
EDRPKTDEARPSTQPVVVRPTAVLPAYAKQKSGGGLVKVAAGGAAGLAVGAVVGGIGAFVMLLKSAKKLIMPFK